MRCSVSHCRATAPGLVARITLTVSQCGREDHVTNNTDIQVTNRGSEFAVARCPQVRALHATVGAAVLMLALGPAALAGGPAVGDSYVYRLVNGYNQQVRGQLQNRVDRIDSNNVTVTVTPDNPIAGTAHTKIYTKEGNWLRHPVESHGAKLTYKFATAYPAYVFPLDPGQSWSARVNATVPGEKNERSVRVDGKVLRAERIRVPAGEFDTVKIRRLVYPGDPNFDQMETQIIEFEWYAPALGRAVRIERRSEWIEPSRCGIASPCDFRGDWDVLELVEARPAKP